MRILFTGDTHLDSQTPLARSDNYRLTTIKKLKSLLNIALDLDVTAVVSTGDFFNRFDIPISYINEVISILKDYRDHGVDFYSIIGNHDIPRNNMVYFKSTPLSLLFESGLVKRLDNENTIKDSGTTIYGMNFTENEKIYNTKEDLKSILVMHYAVDNTVPGESMSTNDLSKNFNIVISGHDHMYYHPVEKNKIKVYRPGSFTRRTKEEYNLKRSIILYMYDTSDNTMTEFKLPEVEPAINVFKNKVFMANTESLYDNKYSKLFSKLSGGTEYNDVFDILEDLPATVDRKSIDKVKSYLRSTGIKELKKQNDLEKEFSV